MKNKWINVLLSNICCAYQFIFEKFIFENMPVVLFLFLFLFNLKLESNFVRFINCSIMKEQIVYYNGSQIRLFSSNTGLKFNATCKSLFPFFKMKLFNQLIYPALIARKKRKPIPFREIRFFLWFYFPSWINRTQFTIFPNFTIE